MAKEHQILFKGPMVRAILEGRKTVTRRAVTPQPALETDDWVLDAGGTGKWMASGPSPATGGTRQTWGWKNCPYGQPGDRLWVRESLGYDCEYGHYFAAGGAHGETVYLCSLFDDEETQTGYSYDGLLPERSVPSIHLHRRYSRILLEVTAARIERLQDITDEQALAEGVMSAERDIDPNGNDYSPCELFGGLWTMINGMESWNANPWVWVVEFRRVEP
ncbi:hypothetical protein [Pseudomonas chlororaphis]|uniref:Phage protein n=1 Tax=Pseudomonas chlororaphis TaxID=587753 RepID=A0AAX3G166_9PSED|nr:hypothetical protein [Pseudomonas chlororaphis]AZC35882.1 Phage protein [Pseudomonas chlororaphis subsp. piscium]AZC42427.1 Phage protein [Pseudomonas chlororaphis subsp. piscium]WDG74349.1 hypothetical protein PUP65_08315 [Pseudomonas chlororaphis]WDH28014.1 hypothetical protein PUP81_25990 [Pseudomonas chlororaphis]WDH72870.1 hypothetical protein PUP78_08315 [Pseudomonas chlororaphis]